MQESPHDSSRVLRVQALVDNELPAAEIQETFEMIKSDPELQAEYVELLRLKRSIGPGPATKVPEEWVARAERSVRRRTVRFLGMTLLLGSYALLLGYALLTLVRSPETPLVVTILISASVLGFLFLIFNAVADRVRERRTDKYRGVVR